MPNQFTPPRIIITPIGPGISYVPLTKGLFAIIDSQRVEEVSAHKWFSLYSKGSGHFYARSERGGEGSISLHAFLMGASGRKITADHVNPGDGLNCLPHNLRLATRSQQMSNVRIRKDNSSGHRGVSFSKIRRLWQAYIGINGKQINLGHFPTKDEAISAYRKAALARSPEFVRFDGAVPSKEAFADAVRKSERI